MEISINNKIKNYVNPIATPLADDKFEKKLLKIASKINKIKGVKMGVREVGKAIRKIKGGIAIFAADVSPPDIISHLPIQCEKREIPYIFVRSRIELGRSAGSKRPTSVVYLYVKEGDDMEEKFNKLKEGIINLV